MPETPHRMLFPNKNFWRALCLTFVFGWLTAYPVNAQTGIAPVVPTPEIPIGEIERGARIVTDAMDRFGSTSVFIVLILVIILALIYFIFRPLSGTVSSSNKDAADARREVAQTNRELLTYVKQGNAVTEGNTDALNGVKDSYLLQASAFGELKTEVHDSSVNIMKSVRDNRVTGVKDVNEYTDSQIKLVNQRLDSIINLLRGLKLDAPDQGLRVDTIIQTVQETKLDDSGTKIEMPKVGTPPTNSAHDPEA